MTDRVRSSRLGALSLRTQLVMLTAVLLALAIAVTVLVAISALRAQLIKQMDSEMQSTASTISSYLVSDQSLPSRGPQFKYSAYLLDEDGNVIHSLPQGSETSSPDLSGWTVERTRQFHDQGITVPGTQTSTSWRIVPFLVDGGHSTMVVATPMKQTNSVIALVGALTTTFGLATLLAACALAWVLVTRAFDPLARVERTAARIAAGDLSQRVQRYDARTEIGQLSRSLNVMLTRIEEAFDAQKRSETKMRRFVGDASHELRTPLVSIRGYSELYRHGAIQTPEDMTKAMSRIEAESVRMGQLVEDLLMLARIDERRPAETTAVDILALANDAAADAEATAPDREVSVIGLDGEPALPATVCGDESRLRQVLANLTTNAMRYTPAGTPLELAVGTEPGIDGTFTAVLKVIDHGPGISEEQAEKVFERFYRADASRTRETGGSGLGLAIVAAIVEQHDGTVRIEQTPGGGATMVLRFPEASPHSVTGEIPQQQQPGRD